MTYNKSQFRMDEDEAFTDLDYQIAQDDLNLSQLPFLHTLPARPA